MRKLRYPGLGLLGLLAGLTQQALAEEDRELPTVIVTVNKQTQALETLPASVTVFDGDELEAVGARSLEDVARQTPGFALQPMGQSGLTPPVMRGITANATSFSASSALVVDGVATLRGQGFDDSLLGVDRIEILRGPQSTLYGRNAEAGVVSIVSRRQGNDPYAALSLEAGSRYKASLRFDVGQALLQDTLYLSLAGEFARQDGFIDNRHSGGKEDDRQRQAGRLALRWTPDSRSDISLRLSQREYDDGGSLWGPTGASRARVSSGTASWNRTRSRSASLDIARELESGLRLRSITAHNEHFDRILQDTDFLPMDRMHLGRDYHFRTLSQEFRLEGQLHDSTWLAGLYLDSEENTLNFQNKTPFALSRTSSTQDGHNYALFTHWNIPLTDKWSLQAGARLERNEIRFHLENNGAQRRSDNRFTPKLALQYQWQPKTMIYASVADGFRAGGFNTFAPDSYRSYAPEKLRALELGIKGSLAGQRLRYSAAVYRMNIEEMQVQQMGPALGQVFITNAASARASGAEAEIRWLPARGWQVQAALGINRTRFQTFRDGSNDYAGNDNPFAPRLNGHLGLRYDAPDGWFAQAQVAGYGRIFVDAANSRDKQRPGYGVINLAAGRRWGQTELTAYVNNAADKTYDTVGYPNSAITIYSPPREFGLRLNWHL